MTAMTPERATEFKQEVSDKIEALLDEFASGSISRAHFDLVYARYSRQLSIAEQALETGQLDEVEQVMQEIPTMMLHAAARGIAVGMTIIHHVTMETIREFGNFDVDAETFTDVIDSLRDKDSEDMHGFSEIQHVSRNLWMAVCSLEHTTLLTLFHNEPAVKQVQELERRHHDFESANRNILNQTKPDPNTLVYPVELFVQAP